MFRLWFGVRRFALARVLIGAILAVGAFPIGVSAAPTVGPLNPEPPDFYTCRATADGAICRAHTIDPYSLEPTGIFCGFGGSTVELLDNGIRDVEATRWYDGDGNLTRRQRMFLFRDTHLTNPATRQVLPYSQHNADNEILGVPGDLASATLFSHGHISITAPGFGVVLGFAGKTVIGPDGDLIVESGLSLLDGDSLCAALGTPNS